MDNLCVQPLFFSQDVQITRFMRCRRNGECLIYNYGVQVDEYTEIWFSFWCVINLQYFRQIPSIYSFNDDRMFCFCTAGKERSRSKDFLIHHLYHNGTVGEITQTLVQALQSTFFDSNTCNTPSQPSSEQEVFLWTRLVASFDFLVSDTFYLWFHSTLRIQSDFVFRLSEADLPSSFCYIRWWFPTLRDEENAQYTKCTEWVEWDCAVSLSSRLHVAGIS